MYTVYLHICPNGKRYYGSTQQDVDKRWLNGHGYKYNDKFWEDIVKYGWINIEHIIVAKELTKDEAYWLEEELIKVFDTTNSDKGYNVAKGGHGANGYKHTEETKNKMSENHADFNGNKHPNAKSVICLTTKRIFFTIREGAKYYSVATGDICKCCQGNRKSAGKLNGQKLVWRYLVWEHNKIYRVKR